jgi:hypothetical protein
MRIPPAVAQQIGQHYASANANDGAARDFRRVTELATSGLAAVERGQLGAALTDAYDAATLINGLASSADPALATARRDAVTVVLPLSNAIEALTVGDAWLAASVLTSTRAAADAGASNATDVAASHRWTADELSRPYL